MPDPAVSNRAEKTPASPIRKLAHLAINAQKAGTRVYKLNIGQPDIESPREYFEGLGLYREKVIAYEESMGNERLCRAWSRYANKTLDLHTRPEQFLITVGASEALVFAFMTCCDPGDEIIIFDPTYANYLGFAAIAGIHLIPVASNMEDNFALPPGGAVSQEASGRRRSCVGPVRHGWPHWVRWFPPDPGRSTDPAVGSAGSAPRLAAVDQGGS